MSDKQLSRRGLLSAAAVTQVSAWSGSQPVPVHPGASKATIVTGPSRGTGAAIGKRLVRDGCRVSVECLTDRGLATSVVRGGGR